MISTSLPILCAVCTHMHLVSTNLLEFTLTIFLCAPIMVVSFSPPLSYLPWFISTPPPPFFSLFKSPPPPPPQISPLSFTLPLITNYRTKRMVVDVLRVQHGENLTEVLYTPATPEQEEEHQEWVKRKEQTDQKQIKRSATIKRSDSMQGDRKWVQLGKIGILSSI